MNSIGNVIASTNSLIEPATRRADRSTSARCCSPSAASHSVPGTRTRRLHLVRDRRPARHRARIHRGGGRRVRRRRLHRRHRRRPDRRLHGAVDQQNRTCRKWFRGLMPVVIIPLFASLVVGLLMFMLLGRPLAAITDRPDQLARRHVRHLGDPARRHPRPDDVLRPRRARSTRRPTRSPPPGSTSPIPRRFEIMAAVMAAGMVPPLAMALASTVRPGLFTEPERENGRAAWLLGASFISEGAIPFAAADPLRVIPSMMFGGAITGALIMAFDVTLEGAARRDLRVLRHRQPAVVPRRPRGRHGGGCSGRHRRQAVREASGQGRRNTRAGHRLIRTINPTT